MEELKSTLIEAGLKVTDARIALLDILTRAKGPQNYEQIKEQLSFSMDKTTFYRNMQTFEKKNLINKFESKDRVWHFELGRSSHAHFMCESCSKIECLDFQIPKELKNCDISSVALKGTCKECKEEK